MFTGYICVSRIKDLLGWCSVAPHVNQVEVHPHFQNRALAAFCADNDIHVTAYRQDLLAYDKNIQNFLILLVLVSLKFHPLPLRPLIK